MVERWGMSRAAPRLFAGPSPVDAIGLFTGIGTAANAGDEALLP